MAMALVGIVIGSKTGTELIQPALDTLKKLCKSYPDSHVIGRNEKEWIHLVMMDWPNKVASPRFLRGYPITGQFGGKVADEHPDV